MQEKGEQQSHMGSNFSMAVRQGGGREIKECYNETKENWSWGMLPGDPRRVTLPQRLKQLKKKKCDHVWNKL
jgi:hypothetical protein